MRTANKTMTTMIIKSHSPGNPVNQAGFAVDKSQQKSPYKGIARTTTGYLDAIFLGFCVSCIAN